MELEEKTFPFEIKAISKEGTFEGYAAVFGTNDALNEVIEPGAFTKTIKDNKQFPMLWYHNPTDPIGIVEVKQDNKGLHVNGQLNMDVQSAREKHSLMEQKAIKGLSFGFKTIVDLWDKSTRRLKEIKLYEISPCTFQAHPDALISAIKQQPKGKLASKPLEGAIEFLKEYKTIEEKSGRMISAANLKLIKSATEALVVILTKLEPSEDTKAGEKGIFSSVIEGLETENKPQEHLFESTIKTLGNIKQEE